MIKLTATYSEEDLVVGVFWVRDVRSAFCRVLDVVADAKGKRVVIEIDTDADMSEVPSFARQEAS
jgi:hypothetical protein